MNTKIVASLILLIGIAMTGRIGIAHAKTPLADTPDGMTCHFYAAAARLAWQQKGGDWIDATGQAYGDESFVSQKVPLMSGRQRIEWNVTVLAQKWIAGAEPRGALLLRTVPGSKSGIVSFHSRENGESAVHPVLAIEWEDGVQTRLTPSADMYFSCPTYKSTGAESVFKVGSDQNAILVFPLESGTQRLIRRASLVLVTDKQYAKPSVIGIFQPMPPWAKPSKRREGIAARFPLDHDIESHPDVIFTDRFESARWRSLWSDYAAAGHAESISADPSNHFEQLDGQALKVTIQQGKTVGLSMHYRLAQHADGEPEEVYFRYYLRFGDNWDPTVTSGKLPGLSGTYNRAGWGGRKSDGVNGWSARGAFFKQSDNHSPFAEFRGTGSYVYHAGMKDRYGDSWGWNLGPTGMLHKNRWYSVEQYVKLNRPGQSDGIFRAWIDGQLAFEKKDMRFRDVHALKIESIWMNVYHGGAEPAAKNMALYLDNVVIARKYIGPFAGSP